MNALNHVCLHWYQCQCKHVLESYKTLLCFHMKYLWTYRSEAMISNTIHNNTNTYRSICICALEHAFGRILNIYEIPSRQTLMYVINWLVGTNVLTHTHLHSCLCIYWYTMNTSYRSITFSYKIPFDLRVSTVSAKSISHPYKKIPTRQV